MDEILILNKLPLPKGYNGHEWNSEISTKRKSIPTYLLSDLPKLQHIYIKKMFQQAQKISCPPISYFDNRIKIKKERIQKINNKKKDLSSLKEQFQYALMLSDRESNVFDQLLEKSARMEVPVGKKKGKRRQLSVAEARPRKEQRDKFFDNTMDLVIRHRQKQIGERRNGEQE